jgi:hypothetical protein
MSDQIIERYGETLPPECRESCGNIARSLVRTWKAADWQPLELIPVFCSEWLTKHGGGGVRDSQDPGFLASLALTIGEDIAVNKLTEFLTDWLMGQRAMR